MSHFHLAVIAAGSLSALLLLFYKLLLSPYFLSPLSKIPNAHFTAPISSAWINRKRRHGQEVLAIYTLHRKHGPIVRLGPRELSVNSLAGLRTIYTGAFEKHAFYRDAFVNFFTENLVGMLGNRAHARQKRMLSKIYSKSYLQDLGDLRGLAAVVLARRLLPVLRGCAVTRAAVNVLPLFQAVGMDFTSAYLFGTANGTVYVSDLSAWGKWLAEYERFKNATLRERYMGFIETWCLAMCRRMQRNDHPNDVPVATRGVVYEQLRSSLEKDPDARPLELAVASELLDHLVAGHETSGITFTYMMWELSQRPRLQAELRRELLTLTPSLQDPLVATSEGPVPALPSPAFIDALPLLDAVVRETLRLHSPAPAPLPRVTPCCPGGTTIEGYPHIPGGIKVSSSAYTLHRIGEVYPQPLEWLPKRWLSPGPGKIHDMRRLFWPFGSGGRMCLGSNFALQEIKLVMAAVYTNYSTSIVDDEGIEQDHAFISLPKGRKLMLKFTPVEIRVE
ncbi:cytochrome P450 [Aspergillus clavatus NRRL 1]|uniref:Cytochrome P450 monooxygenase, putative n=1 Tax=Aspergillus clavatus (strain ATCC 1007 / CBS 513.65 / DSM 816 / NCTC 3887 / NRRL 1 / QM 1276 / 107) TaxID=344612 RepID=A1CC65_ASPCL|nr:cytochrome P450 monooxygenase, putative [Aspergillus clavatus NRRL 1]EAW12122.1 cytochrome P450 monooxygenase, putative [Aspergillus clavatus NRRL 1]